MFIRAAILSFLYTGILSFVQLEIYRLNYRSDRPPVLGSSFIGTELPVLISVIIACSVSALLLKNITPISNASRISLYATIMLIIANYSHYGDILYKLTQGRFEWYDAIPLFFTLVLFYLISFLILRTKKKRQ